MLKTVDVDNFQFQVVLRRLPPTMTEETLISSIQPIPDHDHMYFVPADWSLGVNATSRAYFSFLQMVSCPLGVYRDALTNPRS